MLRFSKVEAPGIFRRRIRLCSFVPSLGQLEGHGRTNLLIPRGNLAFVTYVLSNGHGDVDRRAR